MENYKKLDKQPLMFVLAEFCFSPVMQIDEYIPKLQEALRRKYPLTNETGEQVLQLQPGQITVSDLRRWSFISANKKSAIAITQERLVYYSAEYPRFDGFSEACKQALAALSSIVEPGLIQRIGLRYCDLVKIDESEEISALVDQHFALPEWVGSLGNAQHRTSDTLIATTMGRLIIKTLYGRHNLICLPDLQEVPITVEADGVPGERMILDFDHIWEASDKSVMFETDDILEKLYSLHETSRAAFWKITTEYARNEKWA